MRAAVSFFLLSALLVSCGKDKPVGGGQNPVSPTGGGQKLTLAIFGAPWCGPCKDVFPKLDKAIANDANLKARVIRKLYVTATPKLDQAKAEAYKNALNIDFAPIADTGKCDTYAEMLQNSSSQLPAVAVLKEDGKTVVERFPAGSFQAEDVMAYLKGNLR